MRIPLPTDFKTRTGNPDKDPRQKNSYVELKGDQAILRKRPSAQGGIAVGTGVAQGGIGLNINGVPYFIGFWADTMQSYSGSGTSWDAGTAYSIGAHVTINFEDYWAKQSNTNVDPPNNLVTNPRTGQPSGLGVWSKSYIPLSVINYADLTYSKFNISGSDIYVPEPPIFPTITRTTTGQYDWSLARTVGGDIINTGTATITSFNNYQFGSYASYTQYTGDVLTQAEAVSIANSWGIAQPPSDSRVSFTGRREATSFDGLGNILTTSYSGSFVGLIK